MKNLLFTLAGFIFSIELTCGQIVSFQIVKNWSFLKGIDGKEIQGFDESFQGYSPFIGIDYLNFKHFNLSSNIGYLIKKGEKSYYTPSPYGGSDLETNKTDFRFFTFNTRLDLKYPIRNLIIPYISFGPRLDYLASDKSDSRWTMSEPSVFGMILGGGIKYNISKIQIGLLFDRYINFRSNSKLKSIPTYTGFTGVKPLVEKMSLISFGIGYKF